MTISARDLPSAVGRRIRAARKAIHATQMELAMRSGMHNSVLSNIENGLHLPSAETLIHLSDILGVTIDHLLKGDANAITQPKPRRLP